MDHREESPVTLASKSSLVEEVILAKEDLTKEVEVEEEVNKMSFGAINATSKGISRLNVQEKKT